MRSFALELEAIASWEALRAAWRRYRAGKRRRPEVAAFELDADRRLLHLSRDLLGGNYRHGPYRQRIIRDPKPRLIAAAAVRDRVVHTAVHRALAPLLDRSMMAETFASLPGRGQHRALLRFLAGQRRFKFVMSLDIRAYFASVDHEILRGLLAARIRDRRVRDLVDEILASGWRLYRQPLVRRFFGLAAVDECTRPHGLPIGNLTSQWWGNWYLNGLDHFSKRDLKLPAYLRYMDDLVGFADSRPELEAWRDALSEWLWDRRRLVLKNPQNPARRCVAAQNFLGFRVTRAGYDVRSKTQRRMAQKLLQSGLQPEDVAQRCVGWRGTMWL